MGRDGSGRGALCHSRAGRRSLDAPHERWPADDTRFAVLLCFAEQVLRRNLWDNVMCSASPPPAPTQHLCFPTAPRHRQNRYASERGGGNTGYAGKFHLVEGAAWPPAAAHPPTRASGPPPDCPIDPPGGPNKIKTEFCGEKWGICPNPLAGRTLRGVASAKPRGSATARGTPRKPTKTTGWRRRWRPSKGRACRKTN